MKKYFFLFSILILVISCGGNVNQNNNKGEKEPENQVVDFQFKEVGRIKLNNPDLDDFNVSYIAKVMKDKIYLADCKNVKLFSVDTEGNLLNSFLKKGQGPGEFQSWITVIVKDNDIWVKGNRKICKFNAKGKLLSEFKVKNYYSYFMPLDNSLFFGKTEKFQEKQVNNIFGIFNYSDELQKKLLSNNKPESISLQFGNRYMSLYLEGGFRPQIIASYCFTKNVIAFGDSSDYLITISDLTGKTIVKIGKKVSLEPITDKLKNSILEKLKTVVATQEGKEQVLKQIPDYFTPVSDILFTPNGLLVVKRPKGNGNAILDIFSQKGIFLKSYNVSKDFDIFDGKLFEDKYYKIEETDDGYEIVIYKLMNLPATW